MYVIMIEYIFKSRKSISANIDDIFRVFATGVIRDVTGSYDWFFLVLGTCGIVSGVLIGFGPCTCLKVFKNRKDLNQQNLPQQKV